MMIDCRLVELKKRFYLFVLWRDCTNMSGGGGVDGAKAILAVIVQT
jgi:hypothetical protein